METALGMRLQNAQDELEQKSRQEQQAQDETPSRAERGAVADTSESELKRNRELNSLAVAARVENTFNSVTVSGNAKVGTIFNAVTVQGNLNVQTNFYNSQPKDYLLLKQLAAKEPVSWNLPRQDNVFVGRKELLHSLHTKLNPSRMPEELKEVKEQDESQRMVLTINACAGLGGVGKTQLALEYVHHTKHTYSLKAWFSAEKVLQLEQQYLEFAKDLGYEDEKPEIKGAIKYIKHCLAKYPGWLLVYDNVEKYEDIVPFLPERGGSVLITTRNQKWPDKIDCLPIDVMDENDAIALVQTLSKRNDVEIKELVAVLGYLPLALAQASAYIREKGKTLAEYLVLYKQYEAKLLADKTLPEGADHAPVAVTWNTSLDVVEAELGKAELPALAHALMTVCAYFAPENIPRAVLLGWLESNYPNIEAHEIVLDELLSQLQRYSLITVRDTQSISLHRLVQTVLRYQVQAKKVFDSGVIALTEDWYKHVLEAIHEEFNPETTLLEDEHRERALFPHLQVLDSYYDEVIKRPDKVFELARANVLIDIGKVSLQGIGNPQAAKALLERALKVQEQHYGPEHPEVAVTLTNLGSAYSDLGDAGKAKALLERAFKVKEQHYGPEHEVAITLANLGNAYYLLGDANQAKALLERALKVQEQHYGREHPEVARTLGNLGIAYSDLGDVRGAKALYERALKIQEQHYGLSHPQVAITLYNLVLAHRDLSEHSLAYPLAERCYQIYLKIRGAEHKDTQDAKRLLAQCKDSLDDAGLRLLAKTELIFSKPVAENKHTMPQLTSNHGSQKKEHEKKSPAL